MAPLDELDVNQDPENQNLESQIVEEPEPQEPLDPVEARLKAIEEAQEQAKERYDQRIRELELENARLQGRVEAGVPHQQHNQAVQFETDREWKLAYHAIQQQARLDPDNENVYRGNLAQLESSYTQWQQRQQQREQERLDARLQRQMFMGQRNIDPNSETGKFVEALHSSGVPLERIEAALIEPQQNLAKLRGVAAGQRRTSDVLGAATTIEPGREHSSPPNSITRTTRSPIEQLEDIVVDTYKARRKNTDELLFGDYDS